MGLKNGGRIAIWVYGRENNGVYLALLTALRAFTRRLPHTALAALVRIIDVPLLAYVRSCRVMKLPLAGYMRNVLERMAPDKRRLVIYDQLNPAFAKVLPAGRSGGLVDRRGVCGRPPLSSPRLQLGSDGRETLSEASRRALRLLDR